MKWGLDPKAGSFHANSVLSKMDLIDPRRTPGLGRAECDVASPQTACVDAGAISGPDPLVLYQVLSACGPDGADEGPF